MKTKGLSTLQLRKAANNLRKILKIKPNEAINMPNVYDKLALLDQNFQYEVCDDANPRFRDGDEAYTDLSEEKIYIKESVWISACEKKNSRATFTLGHELGHFIIMCLNKFPLLDDESNKKIYEDPEWQADTFCSEFLMPFDECRRLEPCDISSKFNVSLMAAKTRANKIKNEILKNNVK